MNQDREKRISKFLSLILRHEPEKVGLNLAPGGWVSTDALLAGAANAGFAITWNELVYVVAHNDKQRFCLEDGMIRANQGHSVEVQLELEPTPPPNVLYHGTVERNLSSIRTNGLLKRQRQYVHLSGDVATATTVGARRGKPIVLTVDSGRMHQDGVVFYVSANRVWLTDHVLPQYISVPAK